VITNPKNDTIKLTNRQKAFAEAYSDPTSPTYLNGTQSMITTGHTNKIGSAASLASKALRNDNVLSYIEQLNADNGMGIEDRSQLVADTLMGRILNKTVTQHKDSEGNIISTTEVAKSLTPDQVYKGIDLLNKTEGLYNKANVAEHVAKREYDERMADMREALKGVIAARRGRGEGAKEPHA
jgi:hypothetical protein